MHSSGAFVLTVAFVLLYALSVCQAIELQEIRPGNGNGGRSRGLAKRDMSAFELQSTETFLWGATGKPILQLLNTRLITSLQTAPMLLLET